MSNSPSADFPVSDSAETMAREKKLKRETTNRKKKAPLTEIEDVLSSHNQTTNISHHKLPKQKTLYDCFRKLQSSNGNDTVSSNSQPQESGVDPLTQKRADLQQQLRKKDEMIERLQRQRANDAKKTSRINEDYKELVNTSRLIILNTVKELSQHQRKERGRIIIEYGIFKDSRCTVFGQGNYTLNIKQDIKRIEQLLKELNEQKIKQKQDKQIQDSIALKVEFHKKALKELNDQLIIRQKQVNRYKDRIKLSIKEENSIYAKELWPLIKNRYQPLELIGSGGFGEVYRGYDIQKNQQIAIKINIFDHRISPQNLQNIMKHLKRQMAIHKTLEHPNIVKMIDQLQMDGNRIGIILQYCSGTDLKHYLIKQGGCLDEREAKNIIRQLVYGIKYMHDQKYKIVHYDLKPANIMFHHGVVKIVDFGISKTMETQQTKIDLTSPGIGTYWYLPPQVFDQNNPQISSKVDIWSIGVIFYQILYGRKPFGHGFKQSKILSQKIILNADKVEFPTESPKKYRISQEAKQFIRECLKYNPDDRLGPIEAYNHDYIN